MHWVDNYKNMSKLCAGVLLMYGCWLTLMWIQRNTTQLTTLLCVNLSAQISTLETTCTKSSFYVSFVLMSLCRSIFDLNKQPTGLWCSPSTHLLQQLGAESKQLHALDTLDTIVSERQMPKVTSAYAKVGDVTRTAGLEKTLNLCTGAKVMLKQNKNVEIGLLNGAAGIVVSFEEDKTHDIQQVLVKFHCMDKPLRESSHLRFWREYFIHADNSHLCWPLHCLFTRHKVSFYELLYWTPDLRVLELAWSMWHCVGSLHWMDYICRNIFYPNKQPTGLCCSASTHLEGSCTGNCVQ